MPAAGQSDPFEQHRRLHFTVAYEMLGSVADAEDVLQESWLRWDGADRSGVRDPRAYLVRVVTRQALNRLRTVKRQRETYVGPWLPEPLATTHDVAEATGRSPDAVRQTASRARRHVEARRPRVPDPPDARVVAERFLAAAATGDVQALLEVMAPEVVLVSDGGGVMKAALRPITGADKVGRFLAAVVPEGAEIDMRWTLANGQPSVLLYVDGQLDSWGSLTVADGRVREIYLVRNPEKLRHLAEPVRLSRGRP